ncbi:hypothetical protein D1007_39744 [Hordeum vulgare]|nr:hypothetical protein D1007_39744 [Hordeum vulgare]
MEKLAEKLLCRRLGIVNEGDQITEKAIAKFDALFHDRLPAIAVEALKALFRLDCDLSLAVEDALITHDDGGVLDHSVTATVEGSSGLVA